MTGNRRVVVTGMGVVSALGSDVEKMWDGLLAGRSAARRCSRFDLSEFRCQIACEVTDFDPLDYMSGRESRRYDRFIQFALVAAQQAADQACLSTGGVNRKQTGAIIGSAFGGVETVHTGYEVLNRSGPMRVNPLTVPMMLASTPANVVAMQLGVRGPNYCVSAACASGNMAVGQAWEVIRRGDADVMIAGATDASLTPFLTSASHRTGALTQRNAEPERASRPFDAERDGFVPAEGAAVLVLESLVHAQSRGVPPLAEVIGYGTSADAYHLTAPPEDGAGAALAMRRALEQAAIGPDEVDYINAHGTSTVANDVAETRAIKRVFGRDAFRVPISSTKSMLGHAQGAASAIEAVVCVKTLMDEVIHPTINYEYPDPACDLDYVANTPREADVKVVVSNSFGMGGQNATVILRRFDQF